MKRRSYKNPYNIRGFKSAERKGPELFNFGPFLTEKAAGIEAKSRLRQHYLSMGDATEKISDVRKGRKLVGFRAPSASAWISPVRKNSGRRKNIGDGTYEGHPSFKHWAASLAAMNEYQLYKALSDCPRNHAYAIFIRLHPRLEGAGRVTKELAEYAWDELHADHRKNPRRNPRKNPGLNEDAAYKLRLFIENDGELYRLQTSSIIENLAKKKAKGQYDVENAVKYLGYLVENGARKYAFELGRRKPGTWRWMEQGSDGNGMFPKPARIAVARELERKYRDEVDYRAAELASKKKRNSGIKRIDVDANRWRDGSGNTYHVVSVEVNGKHEWTSPITYGYGTQYEQTAMDWLKKAGYATGSDRALHRFCDDRGIACSSRAHDVKRKKDLGA